MTLLSCHCGAVLFELAHAPETVTECNCSFCRRVGVLWAYYTADEVRQMGESRATTRVTATETTGSQESGRSQASASREPLRETTATYSWNGKHVDFHRCATCGCLTHWVPRTDRPQRGFNARLLDPAVLAAARLRHKDGAVTGKYLD